MKITIRQIGILVVFGLLTIVVNNVSAQSLKVQFDENGVGSSNNTPLLFTYPAVDPVSGLSTLMYQLPFPVTPGDLLITESTGVISDLIRFDNNPAGGVAYFFSDAPDESPSPLADNAFGIPAQNAAFPTATVPEIGVEGNDFAIYLASGGSPGCALQGTIPLTVNYTIISDSPVPEPSTFALLGMGAVGIMGYALRKRK